VADSSLAYDMGRKAKLYAGFGIAELWVIHAVKKQTRIHRDPTPTGYGNVVDLAAEQVLVPVAAADLAVRLSDLELY
jgi:Uma2 family endonuclease